MDSTNLSDTKFETALAELEDIVRRMESGGLELEASLAAYRRGIALLRHCRGQLDEAESEIRVLEENESDNPAPERNGT